MGTSQNIHPQFKYNGRRFESVKHLVDFCCQLKEQGALYEQEIAAFLLNWFDAKAYITVHTSGSTGTPKKIEVLKQHMVHSAQATGVFFKAEAGTSALLCLSANYIAGKMMLVRALVLGWDIHTKSPDKEAITLNDISFDFAAMVPYQVFHSIKALHKIKTLIIGGGVVSTQLENLLQTKKTKAFATYGMTESVTHIALRSINSTDKTEAYTALPNVTFKQDDRGCLVIHANKVSTEPIRTNDLVSLNNEQSFEWLGRFDNVVNSGGIKLFPEQIERKLESEISQPFIISSEKEEALGERLVLVVETTITISLSDYSEIFNTLAPFERPKKVYTFPKFPCTQNGKIKRGEIQKLLNTNR